MNANTNNTMNLKDLGINVRLGKNQKAALEMVANHAVQVYCYHAGDTRGWYGLPRKNIEALVKKGLVYSEVTGIPGGFVHSYKLTPVGEMALA